MSGRIGPLVDLVRLKDDLERTFMNRAERPHGCDIWPSSTALLRIPGALAQLAPLNIASRLLWGAPPR